ncbi:MAG TPA: hypothetical protein VHK90_03740 [Thermoanaerobaculia bacterium]|nr:hypothetical protein [Thermoanaerobaculia bacterium]
MRDDQRGSDPKAGSQDRKTRIDGDRVIHTVKGTPYHGNRYEGPRGLTTEQNEARRTGAKLDERQGREYSHGGQPHKPGIERLDGTDDVTTVKKGRES